MDNLHIEELPGVSKTAPSEPLCNAMSVDVEDYFQVSAFENHVQRADWNNIPHRVVHNVQRILKLFDTGATRATFFTLGWVAERYPELIREVADAGHEIASHGFSHVRVTDQSPEEFSEDITRTKCILEDTTGREVRGFRAASFSIGAKNLWALDILREAGYSYSSSIYPVRHDHYGMPDAPRFPFRRGVDGVLEVPITTVRFLNRNLPCGGGGYFRLLPYGYTRWALKRVNMNDGKAGVFYFHPWEIDPEQPRQPGINLKTRVRHYTNLSRMEGRLSRLLREFKWDRMDKVFLHGTQDGPAA